MTERARINELVQVGLEVTEGTAVAATKRLAALRVSATPHHEINPIQPMGAAVATGSMLKQEWTDLTIEDSVATYDEMYIPLTMALGLPVTTTPGGGTLSRDSVWYMPTYTPINKAPMTFEVGSSVRADRFANGLADKIGMSFSRTDGVKVKGSGFGALYQNGVQLTKNATYTLTAAASPPTSGTYSLVINGTTIAAIPFGASPSALQTLLDAAMGAGNTLVTLLAAGPTTATASTTYTIELRGALAGQAITVTGVFTTLTPSGSITVPAGVVGSTPTSMPLIPIQAQHWNIYADVSAAALGTTQLLRAHSASWELPDLRAPYWVANRANASFVASVQKNAVAASLTLVHQADANGMTYLTQARAGAKVFIRIEAVGPIIEAALTNRMYCDFCVIPQKPSYGSDQEVTTVDWAMAIVHDDTWGKSCQFTLRNQTTGI